LIPETAADDDEDDDADDEDDDEDEDEDDGNGRAPEARLHHGQCCRLLPDVPEKKIINII